MTEGPGVRVLQGWGVVVTRDGGDKVTQGLWGQGNRGITVTKGPGDLQGRGDEGTWGWGVTVTWGQGGTGSGCDGEMGSV